MVFPLSFIPKEAFDEGMRRFGANRDGGKRKHAGCDLYAPVGTPVRAVADGIVTQYNDFYLKTYYLTIDHDDFLIRYGEIKRQLPKDIKINSEVKAGQVIGYVGLLSGLTMSMLHFEMYSNTTTGPLTNRQNKPYQRRSDLIDPTSYLTKWKLEMLISGRDTGMIA